MRRIYLLLIVMMCAGLQLAAQGSTTLRPGDPPNAALISVSLPDDNGVVTVSGAPGAVFPNAQVAVGNMYTEQTVYVNAGITGGFSAQLYGPGSTPFWISVAPNIPPELRNRPGSMPGGPGTIIYGTAPDISTAPESITSVVVDGILDDWAVYEQAQSGESYALLNNDSFYIALRDRNLRDDDFTQVRIAFTADGAVYALTFARGQLRSATARQTAPTARNRGEFAVNAAVVDDVLEIRFPAAVVDSQIQDVALSEIALLDATGGVVTSLSENRGFVRVNQYDGAAYTSTRLDSGTADFYVAGVLANGSSYWSAQGRTSSLAPSAGETLIVELDVTMNTPQLPLTAADLTMIGELGLQPVSVPALNANNGWSSLLTPSGIAIDNLRGDVPLGRTETPWQIVLREGTGLVFGLRFEVTLPDGLPAGLYTPYFRGYVRDEANGTVLPWWQFGGAGDGTSRLPLTRLPVTLNVGEIETQRLYFALFYNNPSEGSRGILPQEDTASAALSNRVRFNSATYILPPGTYPVEPFVPNILSNAYDTRVTPLVPFLFPGGRLSGEITGPDGTRTSLPSAAVVQNVVSTDELDERVRFGAQSPIDLYRLGTQNAQFSAFDFSAYGAYEITLNGTLNDRFGNTYAGGGSYSVLIAELLDLTPGVMAGTPFAVGNAFYPGLMVTPGLPAEISVRVRVYPLAGGDLIEETFTGTANSHGVFAADESFTFETPGEYVIDYEARYTDAENKLWAASLRSAGVIASVDGGLVAHGQRGTVPSGASLLPQIRPAWYNLNAYLPESAGAARLFAPYHSGDVLTYLDRVQSGVTPLLHLHDTTGTFQNWLRSTIPGYITSVGQTLEQAINQDALPLISVVGGPPDNPFQPALLPGQIVSQAYGYVSAVQPGVSIRQFVHGDPALTLDLGWDANDPLNRQIGAGLRGPMPGDYAFVFGGAVVRNAEAGVSETAIYAALAVAAAENSDPYGARVYPPFRGEAGGPDAGPIVTIDETPYTMFFHPTAAQPGQVMMVGEPLVIAGQVAPTLRSRIQVTVTAPDGEITTFEGETNPIGYYFDPATRLTLDRVGIWHVDVDITPSSTTSAGAPEPPLPAGTLLGGTMVIYVTSPDTEPLRWNRGGDIDSQTPPSALFNFTIDLPRGWTDLQVHHTVRTAAYLMESGALRSTSATAGYQYSPPELADRFPHLELEGRVTGPHASDVVLITFAVSGVNPEGEPSLAARTFAILHDRILSFEGE